MKAVLELGFIVPAVTVKAVLPGTEGCILLLGNSQLLFDRLQLSYKFMDAGGGFH